MYFVSSCRGKRWQKRQVLLAGNISATCQWWKLRVETASTQTGPFKVFRHTNTLSIAYAYPLAVLRGFAACTKARQKISSLSNNFSSPPRDIHQSTISYIVRQRLRRGVSFTVQLRWPPQPSISLVLLEAKLYCRFISESPEEKLSCNLSCFKVVILTKLINTNHVVLQVGTSINYHLKKHRIRVRKWVLISNACAMKQSQSVRYSPLCRKRIYGIRQIDDLLLLILANWDDELEMKEAQKILQAILIT
eukprot:g74799.t1